jgi:hypothetical protein
VFDAIGQADVVAQWAFKYSSIVATTKGIPTDLELDQWIIECSNLSEEMNFVFPQLAEPELYLYASIEPIQTQFGESPARPVFLLAEAMNHLLAFCGREKVEPLVMDDHPFEKHYLKYFQKIKKGHPMHYVRDRSKESTV